MEFFGDILTLIGLIILRLMMTSWLYYLTMEEAEKALEEIKNEN